MVTEQSHRGRKFLCRFLIPRARLLRKSLAVSVDRRFIAEQVQGVAAPETDFHARTNLQYPLAFIVCVLAIIDSSLRSYTESAGRETMGWEEIAANKRNQRLKCIELFSNKLNEFQGHGSQRFSEIKSSPDAETLVSLYRDGELAVKEVVAAYIER